MASLHTIPHCLKEYIIDHVPSSDIFGLMLYGNHMPLSAKQMYIVRQNADGRQVVPFFLPNTASFKNLENFRQFYEPLLPNIDKNRTIYCSFEEDWTVDDENEQWLTNCKHKFCFELNGPLRIYGEDRTSKRCDLITRLRKYANISFITHLSADNVKPYLPLLNCNVRFADASIALDPEQMLAFKQLSSRCTSIVVDDAGMIEPLLEANSKSDNLVRSLMVRCNDLIKYQNRHENWLTYHLPKIIQMFQEHTFKSIHYVEIDFRYEDCIETNQLQHIIDSCPNLNVLYILCNVTFEAMIVPSSRKLEEIRVQISPDLQHNDIIGTMKQYYEYFTCATKKLVFQSLTSVMYDESSMSDVKSLCYLYPQIRLEQRFWMNTYAWLRTPEGANGQSWILSMLKYFESLPFITVMSCHNNHINQNNEKAALDNMQDTKCILYREPKQSQLVALAQYVYKNINVVYGFYCYPPKNQVECRLLMTRIM